MGSAYLTLLAVILAGLFAYQLVPALILPRLRVANGWLERSIFWFIAGTFISIVAVHLLVAIRAYETLGLLAVWLLIAYFFKIRPAGGLRVVGDRIAGATTRVLGFLDRSESGSVGVAVREELEESTGSLGNRMERARLRWSPALIVAAIPVAIIILYSFAIRMELALDSVRLARGDSYFHMAWTSLLQDNRIYTDGIYPHGFHAFLSVWDRFHPGSTFDVLRFGGPLIGGMFAVVLYFVGSRATRHVGGGLAAAGIYGIIGMNLDMLQFWNRQISAVPEEFGVLFVPLALYCAARYVAEGDRQLLALATMATAVVAFVHPVPLLFTALGLVCVGVAAIVTGRWLRVPALALWSLLAALAGNLYIVVGYITNQKFYIAFSDFNPLAQDSPAGEAARTLPLHRLLPGNDLYILATVCSVIAALVFLGLALRDRRAVAGLGISGFVAVALIGYWQMGPRISPLLSERSGYLAGSTIPLAFGLLVGSVLFAASVFVRSREDADDDGEAVTLTRNPATQILGVALGAVVLLFAVARFPQTYPEPDPGGTNGAPERIEYESAAVHTLRIAAESPSKTYTIVGTSEDYDRILTRGFHVQLWVFARDIRLEDARNPGYDLPIPTKDVYIYVEKETYPPPYLPPIGPTEEYYRDINKRDRIMRIVEEWSEAYMAYHHDMDVYYEDDGIIIYHLHHNPVLEEMERSPQFKDYTWEPGKLFNE